MELDGEDFDRHRGTVKNLTKQAKEHSDWRAWLCPIPIQILLSNICDLGQSFEIFYFDFLLKYGASNTGTFRIVAIIK